ncbi:substrate-binding domain-containing protein [Streptomyces asiaticus]
MEAVGGECVRLLLARMANPAAPPERVLLEPSLVVRDSTPAPDSDAPAS